MKFSALVLLATLTCALPNDYVDVNTNAVNNDTESLNSDVLELIAGLVDDETTFTLSHTSIAFRNQTQNRINQFKIQALKKNCPGQFNYLTKNGHVLVTNSYKLAQRSYESLEYGDTKEDVIKMLHQRRLCVQSMLTAKNLIADSLDQITIALPPKSTNSPHYAITPNFYSGNDAAVQLYIQRYYASIKLLVDTGLVGKIRINSALRSMSELDPSVEENLYQFLSIIKVPSISFNIDLENEDAFNYFTERAWFVKEIYLRDHKPTFILPASIETLVNKDYYPDLSQSNMPNLKALTLHGRKLPDLTTKHSQLRKLTIKYMADNTSMHTICSKKSSQLLELLLEQISDEIHTEKLKSCLMALKPHLTKFAFAPTFAQMRFWNDFASEFLQDNTVLKELSVQYSIPNEFINVEDVAFMNGTYNQLNLTHFKISGDIQSVLLRFSALFISKQSHLTNVDIQASIPIGNIPRLDPIFQCIAENESIKNLDLTYAVQLKENAIKGYLKNFVATCSLLEGRSIKINGVAIDSVMRDLTIGLDESLIWKLIENGGVEDEKLVELRISPEKYQNEFRF